MIRAYARAGGLLFALVVPWTIIVYPNGTSYVFAWGLVNVDPIHVTTTVEYLFVRTSGLPRHLLAWPTSVLLYALALMSALAWAVWNWEGARVTAGLLAIAGLSHATFAIGLQQPGVLPIPVGSVLLWGLAGVVLFGERSS